MASIKNALTHLQTHRGLPDLLFREVLGNETPKVLLVRTQDELIDELVGQYGTTILPFGTTWLVNQGLNASFRGLNLPNTRAAKDWENLGKSFALYSTLGAMMVSMPFVRNIITALRIGDQNYAQMIGEKKSQGNEKQSESKEAAVHRYMRHIETTLGIGATGLVGFAGAGAIMAKSGREMPEVLRWVNRHLGMKGGNIWGLEGWKAFLFWSIPSYAGYFMAARDKYEFQEIAVKYAAFLFGFFGMPRLVEPLLKRAITKESKVLGSKENQVYLYQALTSIVALGIAPPLMNIWLTHRRISHEAPPEQQASGTLSLAWA